LGASNLTNRTCSWAEFAHVVLQNTPVLNLVCYVQLYANILCTLCTQLYRDTHRSDERLHRPKPRALSPPIADSSTINSRLKQTKTSDRYRAPRVPGTIRIFKNIGSRFVILTIRAFRCPKQRLLFPPSAPQLSCEGILPCHLDDGIVLPRQRIFRLRVLRRRKSVIPLSSPPEPLLHNDPKVPHLLGHPSCIRCMHGAWHGY
jgi:hypothetical protein